MNHEIYADHAATTPIEPLALETMYTAYQEYANPAALYRSALHTKQTVEKARLTVAENLGCTPDHIFFTSGGSEADNQAIISAARSDTIDATIYLACHDAKTGELYGDVEPCAMCKRMIINAGISTVIIRNTHDKYTTINVQSWIEHDDSLEGTDGY